MGSKTYYDNLCNKYPPQQPIPAADAGMNARNNQGDAYAYVFLAADEASYRSGSTIPVTDLE